MKRPLVLAAAFGVALLLPANALAFENQWHVGGGLGASSFTSGGGTAPVLGLHGVYGISDYFDLRLELLIARHSFVENQHTLVSSTSLGLAYKLDVLEWVPWGGISLGLAAFDGDPGIGGRRGSYPAASIDIGLDYAFSRSFAIGGEGRMFAVAGVARGPSLGGGDAAGDQSQTSEPWLTAMLHAEYRWGW